MPADGGAGRVLQAGSQAEPGALQVETVTAKNVDAASGIEIFKVRWKGFGIARLKR